MLAAGAGKKSAGGGGSWACMRLAVYVCENNGHGWNEGFVCLGINIVNNTFQFGKVGKS